MTEANQTAIITGASSGIGAATAKALAARSWRIALVARTANRLQAVARELPGTGHVVWPMDLGDAQKLPERAAALLGELGPVSLLVNNGGGGGFRPFMDDPHGQFEAMMQVHYLAPALLTRLVLPDMLARRQGQIINIASIAADMGPAGHAAYAPAKAALIALTQSLAADYRNSGVHFSYVCPGIIDTPFFDEGSYGVLRKQIAKHAIPPERVAKVITRLTERPRLAAHVPRLYGAVNWIKAASPGLAHRIVASGSKAK